MLRRHAGVMACQPLHAQGAVPKPGQATPGQLPWSDSVPLKVRFLCLGQCLARVLACCGTLQTAALSRAFAETDMNADF